MKNVALNEKRDALVILDQTRLPAETRFLELNTIDEIVFAIRRLAVRGAPAIGIAAAYAYYLSARRAVNEENRYKYLAREKALLLSSRPTAVNLAWALERMERTANLCARFPDHAFLSRLLEEAELIREEDAQNNRKMAEYGLSLLKENDGVLTHCNAGWLATSEYGTALGPVYLAKERNIPLRVYADETRPLLQGARLTAYELKEAGADVTLLCDNMACSLMQKGLVQAVFVGCDRAARNGDCANKIGTAGVAVLAKHFKIPVYFFVSVSTVDMRCKSGRDIVIEERGGEELTHLYYEKPMAPEGVKTYNPAFDVTDHSLITVIVTERGIVRAPFSKNLKAIMEEKADV
ncbi:MAG TPA: S-methyl-5-thioribose-1-phosphate isomerase [Clostridia bacterium]|nr:S-methyl-5-thioribose-1-phosphate isomerase [Clostridia bacterium]